MAKKVDVSFMKFVTDADSWKREVVEPAGLLIIVDAYNSTWGPCEMLAGHFSNMYFDMGEKFAIKFVRAQLDDVAALKEHAGRSKPMFLIYMDGEEIEKIDGAKIPDIKKAIETKAPAVK